MKLKGRMKDHLQFALFLNVQKRVNGRFHTDIEEMREKQIMITKRLEKKIIESAAPISDYNEEISRLTSDMITFKKSVQKHLNDTGETLEQIQEDWKLEENKMDSQIKAIRLTLTNELKSMDDLINAQNRPLQSLQAST